MSYLIFPIRVSVIQRIEFIVFMSSESFMMGFLEVFVSFMRIVAQIMLNLHTL